jgi:hypothetical protein
LGKKKTSALRRAKKDEVQGVVKRKGPNPLSGHKNLLYSKSVYFMEKLLNGKTKKIRFHIFPAASFQPGSSWSIIQPENGVNPDFMLKKTLDML